MRLHSPLLSIFVCVFLFSPLPSTAQPEPLKAFPGAEGYGSLATGGRGGEVYIVTHLGDSGPGSLRHGLETASGPRTIVFEAGGIIQLNSTLRIQNKRDLTIAGQTAPGQGILLKDHLFQTEGCQNLIVRHLRVRYGWDKGSEADAVWLRNTRNAILDHLSVSWGMDECFSMTRDTSHITVQNCIIAEGAKDGHQYGMLINSETPGGGRFTLVGNLMINHLGRMPRANSDAGFDTYLDMVNNVLYNWSTRGDWGVQGSADNPDSSSHWNFVNNYSIAGRNTGADFYRKTILRGGEGIDRFYISGNKCDHNVDGVLDGEEVGWDFVKGDKYVPMDEPFSVPDWAAVGSLRTPDAALQRVIADAGARPWGRDAVDARLIEELQSWGTQGFVVTRLTLPQWPTLTGGPAPPDSDRDGKPDYWEEWYGADPALKSHNQVGQGGYTALELYLQWLIDPKTVFAPGDLNGDNAVNTEDLFQMRAHWGGSGKGWAEGDQNGDGKVNLSDLAAIAKRWTWRSSVPVAPPSEDLSSP